MTRARPGRAGPTYIEYTDTETHRERETDKETERQKGRKTSHRHTDNARARVRESQIVWVYVASEREIRSVRGHAERGRKGTCMGLLCVCVCVCVCVHGLGSRFEGLGLTV